jgi:hypothetical protein
VLIIVRRNIVFSSIFYSVAGHVLLRSAYYVSYRICRRDWNCSTKWLMLSFQVIIVHNSIVIVGIWNLIYVLSHFGTKNIVQI